MHEAVSRAEGKEAWANRGIVIRKWEAKLGGKMVGPWAAERGVEAGHGGKSSIIDILPPPYLEALQPGDYVECEIEHVVVPQFADDYYGPNENLRAALAKDSNTWKMIYREAIGNDLAVRATLGKVIRARPTTIQAFRDRAKFTITGGLGYAPITITGLSNYHTPYSKSKRATSGRPSISPFTAKTTGRPITTPKPARGRLPTAFRWTRLTTSASPDHSGSGLRGRDMTAGVFLTQRNYREG